MSTSECGSSNVSRRSVCIALPDIQELRVVSWSSHNANTCDVGISLALLFIY